MPSVKLIRAGQPSVVAANVAVKSNLLLTCTFNLVNAAEGLYDLLLDVSGATNSLPKAFQVLKPVALPGHWELMDMGVGTTPSIVGTQCGVSIGDGDNSGVQKMYATNRNAKFSEFAYQGSSWSCAQNPVSGNTAPFSDVLVADITHDGQAETYVAAQDNHVYQYSGASWGTKTDLGSGTNKMVALCQGDGNNDGEPELYAACADGHAYQFKYSAGSWAKTDLGAAPAALYAITCGDGDNDSQFEVYASCLDHNVYQFKYNGTSWATPVSIGAGGGTMFGLAVADPAHDGDMRLFGANEDHNLYQFQYGSPWSVTPVAAGKGSLYKVAWGDADNSGAFKLYTVCGDGHVYQVRYENSQWLTADLGSVQTSLYSLALGDADNDNQYEVYVLGDNSHAYQFKFIHVAPTLTPTATPLPTQTAVAVPGSFFKAYNSQINPAQGTQAKLRWYQPQDGAVKLTVFNLLGDKVVTLVNQVSYTSGQRHEVLWDGRNQAGKVAGSGIYIAVLEAPGYKSTAKVAVVK